MTDSINIAVLKRDVFGKKLRALRESGLVPAVLHNHGEESIHISIDEKELNRAYSQAGKHHPLEVEIDGSTHTTLIKDVDFEPAKSRMRHVVFQIIRANEKVEAMIPLDLVGDIPAQKSGLQVIEQLKEVEVRGLTKDLVDKIEIDASALVDIGDTITTSDLKLPEGLELVTDSNQVIASIEAPVDQLAEAEAAAKLDAIEAASDDETDDNEAGETSDDEVKNGEETNEKETKDQPKDKN